MCVCCSNRSLSLPNRKVHDNYNNYDEQKHVSIFSYRIEKISSVFAITCIVLAFVYILFAIIYTTCGGMSDGDDGDAHSNTLDAARRSWANYEMSSSGHRRGERRRRRHGGSRSRGMRDKQEPLVGPGGITDNEGFITDMVSTSSGSSGEVRPWVSGLS